MKEKIARLLFSKFDDLDSSDEDSQSLYKSCLEDAKEINNLLRDEIEKVKNPYENIKSIGSFETCRRKILELLA